MSHTSLYVCIASLASLAGAAQADFIFVPQSTTDTVMLLDSFDGSLVDANFLDIGAIAAAEGVSSTPIEVLEVNNELWVSDQLADRIWRFDQSGGYLGAVGVGELNNIRGMQLVGSTLYVSQGSDGTTFGEGIVTVDVNSGTVTGSFIDRDPADVSYWDIAQVGNELYVTNSDTGNDGIERYSLSGDYLGNLVSSDGVTGLDFGQQIFQRDNGNLLVGGFSPPSGVFEFAADGTDLGIVAGLDFGPRAAIDLDNGDILWTNGTWVRTDTDILVEGSSFRFFTRTTIPAPGSLALLGLGSLATLKRRR
jgi:hypothetical protein